MPFAGARGTGILGGYYSTQFILLTLKYICISENCSSLLPGFELYKMELHIMYSFCIWFLLLSIRFMIFNHDITWNWNVLICIAS